MSKNRDDDAEAYLTRALAIDPANVHVRANLGIVYFEKGEYDRAIQTLEPIANPTGEDADPIEVIRAAEFLGRSYMKQGRFADAEQVLTKSTTVYDRWLEEHGNQNYWGCPYQALGELYSRTGAVDKETEFYLRAADLEIHRPNVQLDAAERCYSLGDYDRALTYVDRAIALDESRGDLLDMKGMILLGLKRYGDAERLFRHAKNEMSAFSIYNYIGRKGAAVGLGHLAVARKKYDEAIERFDEATPWTFRAFVSAKRYAIKELADKDSLYDYDAFAYEMAYVGMAWAYANQNRHEPAIECYDRVLALEPWHLLALLGKGNSLTGMKKLDEAEAIFATVIEHYPNNKFALAERGLIRYNRGEYDSAEDDFEAALKLDDGTYTCPYEGLGLVYLTQGRKQEAEANFKKAIELNPSIEYKKFNGLAKIYIQQKKYDEAAALLKQSIRNYPYDDEARKILASIQPYLEP